MPEFNADALDSTLLHVEGLVHKAMAALGRDPLLTASWDDDAKEMAATYGYRQYDWTTEADTVAALYGTILGRGECGTAYCVGGWDKAMHGGDLEAMQSRWGVTLNQWFAITNGQNSWPQVMAARIAIGQGVTNSDNLREARSNLPERVPTVAEVREAEGRVAL